MCVFLYSKHFLAQLSCMHEANSITLDPHKSGFCPYPAGGLLYRFSQSNLFSRFLLLPRRAGGLLNRFSQSNFFSRFF